MLRVPLRVPHLSGFSSDALCSHLCPAARDHLLHRCVPAHLYRVAPGWKCTKCRVTRGRIFASLVNVRNARRAPVPNPIPRGSPGCLHSHRRKAPASCPFGARTPLASPASTGLARGVFGARPRVAGTLKGCGPTLSFPRAAADGGILRSSMSPARQPPLAPLFFSCESGSIWARRVHCTSRSAARKCCPYGLRAV